MHITFFLILSSLFPFSLFVLPTCLFNNTTFVHPLWILREPFAMGHLVTCLYTTVPYPASLICRSMPSSGWCFLATSFPLISVCLVAVLCNSLFFISSFWFGSIGLNLLEIWDVLSCYHMLLCYVRCKPARDLELIPYAVMLKENYIVIYLHRF